MSFNKELNKLVKEAIGEELKVYLDGLISIKNRSKQAILKKALKKMKKNRYELAIRQFQDYTKKFALEDNEKCSILNLIGLSQYAKGENKKAKNTFLEIISIAEKIKKHEALSAAKGNLGNVYLVLGEHKKALEYHQEAFKIDRRIGNPRNQAFTLFNIGVTLLSLESHERGLNFFIKAREKFSFLGLIKLVQEVDRNIDMASNHFNYKISKKLH